MGWVTGLLTQVAITSIAIGYLKRIGAIQVQPSAIKNDSARYCFSQACFLGEEATIMAERMLTSVTDEVAKQQQNNSNNKK